MSISSDELGNQRTIDLPQGELSYRERGSGPPILFVHGLWVNGDHWRKVVPLLADRYRCITPDLPLGAHDTPLDADADVSPPGVARMLGAFIAALNLDEVTVVANDTGDLLAQLLVAGCPERVGRLILNTGDAFTNFLPWLIKPMRLAGFFPGVLLQTARFWNTAPGQRILWSFLTKRRPGADINESYFAPAVRDDGIRRDLGKFLRGAGARCSLAAAGRLGEFDRPVLVIWTRERRLLFPASHGPRLANRFPDAELAWVDDSRAFIPEDQPGRLAGLVSRFCERTEARSTPTLHLEVSN